MKPEIIIRDWLRAWFKPEDISPARTEPGQKLTEDNFQAFIEMFKDDTNRTNQFSEDEIAVLKRIILRPLKFATGYPLNDKETIQQGAIYFVEGGWQQASHHIGANFVDGRANTYIAITGQTAADTLNMAEPSLLLQLVTTLLVAGRQYLIANHLNLPMITETLYQSDERLSRENGIAMRTLTISYEAHRYMMITPWYNK